MLADPGATPSSQSTCHAQPGTSAWWSTATVSRSLLVVGLSWAHDITHRAAGPRRVSNQLSNNRHGHQRTPADLPEQCEAGQAE